MEGYLYLRSSGGISEVNGTRDGKSGAPKWSKRFCSLVVDPKRGPFFVARKRIEEEYSKHKMIEHHVPFATSVVKLTNYRVAVMEDTSAGPDGVVGGVIRLTHETMDVVELRDKSLERAKKWAISIKSTLKAWDMCPPTPAQKSPVGRGKRGNGQEENRRNDGNMTTTTTAKRKTVVFNEEIDDNGGSGGGGRKASAEYKATMAKFNNDQLVKSAAQAALVTSDDTTADNEQDENDYKESLKAKAQSQVLLMDSKRRFLEEKRAAELEDKRKRQREEEEESAQKEMSQLLAEAEKRQAEKQRLLEESQLQTEELQRKALAAAKRAEDMISKNEAEMQKLLEEANRKKELAEQLSKERAEEERQKKVQEEMMRQLEEQRRERERLEREEAQRRKEQEEIEALKKTLERKLQGHAHGTGRDVAMTRGLVLPAWGMLLGVCLATLCGYFLSVNSPSVIHFLQQNLRVGLWKEPTGLHDSMGMRYKGNMRAADYGGIPTVHATDRTYQGAHDLSRGVDIDGIASSDASFYHGMDVKEVLREAPREELVAALSSLAETRDLELYSQQGAVTSGGRGAPERQVQRRSGFPNVFRALLLALTSPIALLRTIFRKLVPH